MRAARLALAGLLLAAAGCAPAPEGRGTLALAECRLPGLERPARCGTHEVWEDREARQGRRIAIHVAVIPARRRAPEPDPVLVLAGGPGPGVGAFPLTTLTASSTASPGSGTSHSSLKLPSRKNVCHSAA